MISRSVTPGHTAAPSAMLRNRQCHRPSRLDPGDVRLLSRSHGARTYARARTLLFFNVGFDRYSSAAFSRIHHTGVFSGNLSATLTLAMLVVSSIALVAANDHCAIAAYGQRAGWQTGVGGTGYFRLSGSAHMIEIALLQRNERLHSSAPSTLLVSFFVHLIPLDRPIVTANRRGAP